MKSAVLLVLAALVTGPWGGARLNQLIPGAAPAGRQIDTLFNQAELRGSYLPPAPGPCKDAVIVTRTSTLVGQGRTVTRTVSQPGRQVTRTVGGGANTITNVVTTTRVQSVGGRDSTVSIPGFLQTITRAAQTISSVLTVVNTRSVGGRGATVTA